MVEDTSIKTYYKLLGDGTFNEREAEVFKALIMYPESTDRELAEKMGKDDPNYVRPRRKDLVDKGYVINCGKRDCSVSGEHVNVWRVSTFEEINNFEPQEEILKCLSSKEMKKIQNLLFKANQYQKETIKGWCN